MTSSKGKYTRWTAEDWFLITRFLYQANAITTEADQDLRHIRIDDIRRAAKEITNPARRREDVTLNISDIRRNIHHTLMNFKEKLEGSALKHSPADLKPEVPPVVRIEQPDNTLMDVLAQKVVGQITQPLLHELKLFVAQTMIDYAIIRTDLTAAEVVIGKQPAAPKRARVGLIGLLPIQYQSFVTQFPEIDFTLSDGESGPRTYERLKNHDFVMLLTTKSRHGIEPPFLKNMGKEKFRRVAGGPTAMAHQLRSWLATQTA